MAEPSSPCAEKTRLLEAYTAATSGYSQALETLQSNIGVLRKSEYDRLLQSVEEARTRSEETRAALERHVREHGC